VVQQQRAEAAAGQQQSAAEATRAVRMQRHALQTANARSGAAIANKQEHRGKKKTQLSRQNKKKHKVNLCASFSLE
jgi:hypothetical protein